MMCPIGALRRQRQVDLRAYLLDRDGLHTDPTDGTLPAMAGNAACLSLDCQMSETVGPGALGICSAPKRDNGRADGGGNMHQTGVGADRDFCPFNDADGLA